MNDKIICICYSRTGLTKRVMEDIAFALDCELVFLHDSRNRQGALGWMRCGLDAMRRRTYPVNRLMMERRLSEYDLAILGTPVWAGRCASVTRGFLKRRGYELGDVAYVLTHGSDEPYREVFDQMDRYLTEPHVAEVTLRPSAPGWEYWRDQFLKTVAERMGIELRPIPAEAPAEAETES